MAHKNNPSKPDLTLLAKAYARRRPRRNPPQDEELEQRVDGFLVEQKQQGASLSTWTEVEWRGALGAIGVAEGDMPIYLDQVAGWGVDD